MSELAESGEQAELFATLRPASLDEDGKQVYAMFKNNDKGLNLD